MFNEMENLLRARVESVDDNQLEQHVQTAATNAANNGDQNASQLLANLLSGKNSEEQISLEKPAAPGETASGGSLKQEVITLIKSNPQILRYFEGAFAQDILARI